MVGFTFNAWALFAFAIKRPFFKLSLQHTLVNQKIAPRRLYDYIRKSVRWVQFWKYQKGQSLGMKYTDNAQNKRFNGRPTFTKSVNR